MATALYYALMGTFIAIPILVLLFFLVAYFLDDWNAFEGTFPKWLLRMAIFWLVIGIAQAIWRSLR